MEYKAPKLKLKKRKMPDVNVGKESDIGGKLMDGKGKKLKMAKIPSDSKKEGKIIRLKRKSKKPSAGEMKFMRKDYERETERVGKRGAKYMLEKKRLEGERDIYKKILRLK